MDCPHIEEHAVIRDVPNGMQSWVCAVCNSEEGPWLCLKCGLVSCSRYVKSHMLQHASEQGHQACIDCNTLAAYCYICDDFVNNDTHLGHIQRIRNLVKRLNYDLELKENVTNGEDEKSREAVKRLAADAEDDIGKKRARLEENNLSLAVKNCTKRPSRPKSSGLRNLGNTCFMNAVLQSLSNVPSFRVYMKSLPSLETKVAKQEKIMTRSKTKGRTEDVFLVEELRKTIVALWQGNKTAISPGSLFCVIWKVVPRFRGYAQQDAHEFMRYLLDRLHTELLTLLPCTSSTNHQFIGQKSKQTIDLSLDIPSQFVYYGKLKPGEEPPPKCYISDCLTAFTSLEELEDSELYYCTQCKCKQRSTKRFWLRSLPNVLCIHMKRFRWNSFYRVKVDCHVSFPLRGLDMRQYMLDDMYGTRKSGAGSYLYDLAAVVVHHGTGAGSGHYTSYAVNDNVWYHFNDSTVTSCDEETVLKCKAYILFYVKRELRIPDYLTPAEAQTT